MRRRVALAASFAAVAVAGCGGADSSDDSSSPARPPETVGTPSAESAQEAIIQDLKTIQTAMGSGQYDEGVVGIYDLMKRAGEMDEARGEDEPELSRRAAELYLAELPRLVAMLEESDPLVRQRLKAARFKTEAGEKLRQIGFSFLTDQLRTFQALRDFIVASYDPTWGDLNVWFQPVHTGDYRRRLGRRFNALVRSLSPDERKAMRRAIPEVFGAS
jgi:hypothetical protein